MVTANGVVTGKHQYKFLTHYLYITLEVNFGIHFVHIVRGMFLTNVFEKLRRAPYYFLNNTNITIMTWWGWSKCLEPGNYFQVLILIGNTYYFCKPINMGIM